MAGEAILALDVGTSSCRAIAFDAEGRLLGRRDEEYPLLRPHTGWVEHDPRRILAASGRVIRGVVENAGVSPSRYAAVCVSTYLHSLLALDADVEPLSNIILWNDTRSADEVDRLRASHPELYRRTGCPPHTMYAPPKLLWLRAHAQELWARTRQWGSVKDLLLHRLTGSWAVDLSIASGSGLLNLQREDWDEEALTLSHVTPRQLPQLAPTTAILQLDRAGAELTGLRRGTPVVAGAGDGVLSNLGAGAISPGVVAVMVGSSGAVRTASPQPRTDPRLFCYNLAPGCWITGGAISNGGLVLKWLRDQWGDAGTTYQDITTEAAGVPAGSDALLFMPLLTGERSPDWNSRARGALVGFGLEHGPAHMYRAALEGVTFQLNSVREALADVAGPAAELRATGGLSRSDLWVQMCADVFGQPVAVGEEFEGSALGAFLLARHALGADPDLAAAARRVTSIARVYTPNAERHAQYLKLYRIYRQAYASLQETFAALAEVRTATE